MEMQRKREYRGNHPAEGKYGIAEAAGIQYGIAEVASSGKYGIAEVSGMQSNLPVDIPTVKGKWPYRYVSEFPLRQMTATQAQDTQCFRISLLAVVSGVPEVLWITSSNGVRTGAIPGNKGVHKLIGLCQFGLAYHKTNCIFCVIGHDVTAKVYHQSPVDANQFSCGYKSEGKQGTEYRDQTGTGYAPGYASGNFSKFLKILEI
ncbi:hypothetical protein T03_11179 [Trichinella britovi]|uniref:Uncharacterized protein n=1 Tax=Trichinella britovi TaxID=45882 RepID=A0A0V1CFX5_TRIBR|nr:hypothetical protein T03_11179 [Trichinella britovi]